MKFKFNDRSGIIWITWLIGAVGVGFGLMLYDRAKDINASPLDFLLQLFTIWLPLFLIIWSSFSLVNYYLRIKGKVGDFLEIFDDRIILPNTDSIFIPFLKRVNEVKIASIKSLEVDTIGMVGVSRLKICAENHRNLVVTSKNLGEVNFENLLSYFKDKWGKDFVKRM